MLKRSGAAIAKESKCGAQSLEVERIIALCSPIVTHKLDGVAFVTRFYAIDANRVSICRSARHAPVNSQAINLLLTSQACFTYL